MIKTRHLFPDNFLMHWHLYHIGLVTFKAIISDNLPNDNCLFLQIQLPWKILISVRRHLTTFLTPASPIDWQEQIRWWTNLMLTNLSTNNLTAPKCPQWWKTPGRCLHWSQTPRGTNIALAKICTAQANRAQTPRTMSTCFRPPLSECPPWLDQSQPG